MTLCGIPNRFRRGEHHRRRGSFGGLGGGGRREFITLLGSAAAAWPLAARAQPPTTIARVGWLSASLNNPVQALGHEVLVSALRRLGFTEGENLVLEHRPADQGMAKAFAGADELVAAKADVLIADGPELALQAATAARPVVPVVMLANNYNPFERGYPAGWQRHWRVLPTTGAGREATRTVGRGVSRAEASSHIMGCNIGRHLPRGRACRQLNELVARLLQARQFAL